MTIQQEFFTSREAATRLGVSDARVRQLCIKYDYIGTKHGNAWLLTSEDLRQITALEEFGKKIRPAC